MSIDIDTIYIRGQWVAPSSTTGRTAIQSPATGERASSVIAAGESDVDRAVAATRAASDDPHGWWNWKPSERAAVLDEFSRKAADTEDKEGTKMKKFGFATVVVSGLAAAVLGLAGPAQADIGHRNWVVDTQQHASVGSVTASFGNGR
jgi:hypothetical protein